MNHHIRVVICFLLSAVVMCSCSPGMSVYADEEKDDGVHAIHGMDFSYYSACLGWGKSYKGFKNEDIDLFEFVKTQGVNTVSVMVSADPGKASDDAKYFSLKNAMNTIRSANKAGLDTNLILLYSDEITYANKQQAPVSWGNEADHYEGYYAWTAQEYTRQILSELKENAAMPSMITIGNEINYNFLGYVDGEDGNNAWRGWEAIGKISQIIKTDNKDTKVAIGLAAPSGEPTGIQWSLNKLNEDWIGCDYDYVLVNVYENDTMNEDITAMREQFIQTQSESGRSDTGFCVSGIAFPYLSLDEREVTLKSQRQKMLDTAEAAGGNIIFDQAVFCGSWKSLAANEGQLTPNINVFNELQGDNCDFDASDDYIYEFGLESGLKDQEVTFTKVKGMDKDTICGVDISSYEVLKDAGVKYYDENGDEASLLKVLSDHGVNYVRLRIWNDPTNSETGKTYGGGANDAATSLKIAKEASKYGMKVLLCFHYSDFWASPGIQNIPKAWRSDENNVQAMEQNIYEFTKDTIKQFMDEGVDVGMVQIGNEITKGMVNIVPTESKPGYKGIWGDKNMSKKLDRYIASGIRACRLTAPDALIALHLETPNVEKYQYIMDVWERDGLDYDVLGTSYYPFWKQKIQALDQVQKIAEQKGKLFAVLETSWLNDLHDADGMTNKLGEGTTDTSAYSVGVQEQVDVLTDQYATILSHDNGLGAFYWEPAWLPVKPGWVNWEFNKESCERYGTGWASSAAVEAVPHSRMYYNGEPSWGGTGWDNQGLFDFNGYPLKSLNFYNMSKTADIASRTTLISLVDRTGNKIAADVIVKTQVGSIRSISLPKVAGYYLMSYKYTIHADTSGIVRVRVQYNKQKTIGTVTLSKAKVIFNGKVQKPKVTVKSRSTVLASKASKSNDKVTIKYSTGFKNVGKHVVTVTGKGVYGGKINKTFKIVPKGTSIKKLKNYRKAVKVKWKKQKTKMSKSRITGYQIVLATNSKFTKNKKTITVKGYNKNSKEVKNLKGGKKYYVKIRTYKTVSGINYYSPWSKVKIVKTKK